MQEFTAIAITELSQVGQARRQATAAAEQLNFDETATGKLALVVTEIARNLVLHAREGEMLLRYLENDEIHGIEILALDKGPGMANIAQCLRDGFSTAGTPGKGLGAVERLSDVFDIYSLPGNGTVLLSQIWAQPLAAKKLAPTWELGAVCLPIPGEEVCGDAWEIWQEGNRCSILVADGLGHGLGAADASRALARVFRENASASPSEILRLADGALRTSRGAVAAIARIDDEQQVVCFAGIGNISARIVNSEKNSYLTSHNGIVGHEVQRIQEFTYPWLPESILIVHSDGLSTHWQLDKYPGLVSKHASAIAGVLYRDFNRGRDDATVAVVRTSPLAGRDL